MTKKKIGWIIGISAAVLALLAAAVVWLLFFRQTKQPEDPNELAYVTPVSDIIGGGGLGLNTRFSGVVEPQQTLAVQKDDSKKVDRLYVTVGQQVEVGDPLFSYDMDDLSLQLQEAELQLESLRNRIDTLKDQIQSLEKEKKNASSDDKLYYTLQIQSLELEIKTTEYDQSSKAKEIEHLRMSLENSDVLAEMAGMIKEINENSNNNNYDYYAPGEQSNAFITILATGQYRVKATVTELNLPSLWEGMPIRVISRVNPEQSWTGMIERIEYEPITNENNYVMYGSEDSFTPASKYNFYILLDDYEGLILGQHVYAEPDTGAQAKTGIWLPGSYLYTEGSQSYVWAADARDRIEKRKVSLGGYDAETDEYEILDGLSPEDAIAFHGENMHDGMYAVNIGDTGNMPGTETYPADDFAEIGGWE
ncbi:MAG: efflux RND transporter periplasmic adaptor subunit [Clostridia bacterium]|nr:efflux RND transporter periplasmic adaptor subunit [Clostridia bacterium]